MVDEVSGRIDVIAEVPTVVLITDISIEKFRAPLEKVEFIFGAPSGTTTVEDTLCTRLAVSII